VEAPLAEVCCGELSINVCRCNERDRYSLEFQNIAELIRIVCTIPVFSCECERSASALRRLHTWSRALMSQERLSALAMLHIHYDHHIDLSEVVDKFSKKYPRRLELDNKFTTSMTRIGAVCQMTEQLPQFLCYEVCCVF